MIMCVRERDGDVLCLCAHVNCTQIAFGSLFCYKYMMRYDTVSVMVIYYCSFHTDFLDSCRANTLLAELEDEEDLPEPDDDDDENEDDNQEDQEYEEVLVRVISLLVAVSRVHRRQV